MTKIETKSDEIQKTKLNQRNSTDIFECGQW